MTAIRVIFDGKTFVPQQPVTLPADSEALVIVEQADPAAQARLDAELRAYYTSLGPAGADEEDEARAKGAAPDLSRAWDED